MSAISVQLARLRVARGLTQQQLAERTGLRRDTISALERGKSQAIEFETLALLCDALQVQAGDILMHADSAHTAPILGGEDEDEIIVERLADAEEEIATLLADPALAARGLFDEVNYAEPVTQPAGNESMPAARLLRDGDELIDAPPNAENPRALIETRRRA